jgi:uncharacterized membrane protein YkvA (DUF1232 family)
MTNADMEPRFLSAAKTRELQARDPAPVRGDARVQAVESLQRQVCAVWMILKEPRTPWYVRVIAACTLGYLLSPVQLIPSFIPIIGLLDDVAVVWLGFKLIQRFAPADIVDDCKLEAARLPLISASEMKRLVRTALGNGVKLFRVSSTRLYEFMGKNLYGRSL